MASVLEQFVNNVRTLSVEANFKELSNIVGKYNEVLVKNHQHLDNVLETLDLEFHTIGILAVLNAKLVHMLTTNLNLEVFKPVLSQLQEFITSCNKEHVKYVLELYGDLCHNFASILIELKCPMRGITLLTQAILKIQSGKSQLTSIHSDLCKICLVAKCFKPALEFLDVDITCISGIEDAKYLLLYYYYGGMIYTALKNYDRALYFYEVCVMTPAAVVSHIMLEALKKYILVSLILNGKIVHLPNYTSALAKRQMKRLCQPYQDLANAFSTNSVEEMTSVISKHEDVFERDSNLGIVQQVLSYLYKKNIQRLTNTFLTLSLTDVASRVNLRGPTEAEKYILNMIEEGEIFATINQTDGMVVFHDDPEKYNSPRMLAKLEKEMSECVELGKKVLEMEEEVIVCPMYIHKSCGGKCDEDDQAAGPPPSNVTNSQSQPKHNTYSM